MKKKFILKIFLASFFLTAAASVIQAQGDDNKNFVPPPEDQNVRANLMRGLGLSKEQIQQIRKLNGQRGPLMQDAQRKLREANRLLDQAIYADDVDETLVETRLREQSAAQNEVFRIRAMSELEIRKVLTSEQLLKFRELRERFRERREGGPENKRPLRRPGGNPDREPIDRDQPPRRPQNGQRP